MENTIKRKSFFSFELKQKTSVKIDELKPKLCAPI